VFASAQGREIYFMLDALLQMLRCGDPTAVQLAAQTLNRTQDASPLRRASTSMYSYGTRTRCGRYPFPHNSCLQEALASALDGSPEPRINRKRSIRQPNPTPRAKLILSRTRGYKVVDAVGK
jgi:hypothetical protein